MLFTWIKLFLCQSGFTGVGGARFTCCILSVEDTVGGSAPHLGCPAREGLRLVWLWEAWPLVLCVPRVCWGCSCLRLGLSASYSASEEPHCLFWEPSLSATAGSWESATSLFLGSTSSQHGWPPLGNSPLLEIRQFQSSNMGKQIVNGIYCDVSAECVLPAQRE